MITLKNNAQSVLASSLEAGDTELRVSLGDGALFPDIPVPGADWFRAALADNAGNAEYVKVTARDGDLMTVTRGEEGSVPHAWTAGARIQVRMTARTWAEMAGQLWMRMTAADGSVAVPTRISDRALRVSGDWTKEAHPRRALRVAGSDELFYIAESVFASEATTITISEGVLPANLPALDLGVPQEMMPETHALSNAVDSSAQNVGASSLAVKTAYGKAVEARADIDAAKARGQIGDYSAPAAPTPDFNVYTTSGVYGMVKTGQINGPGLEAGTLYVATRVDGNLSQLYLEDNRSPGRLAYRTQKSGVWTPWRRVLTTDGADALTPADIGALPVNGKAASAGTAETAGVAAKLGQSGNAGVPMTFLWSGQPGQPSWMWGSNDGANHYVYNPANFSVNYAASSGYAASAGSTASASAFTQIFSKTGNALPAGGTWRIFYLTTASGGSGSIDGGQMHTRDTSGGMPYSYLGTNGLDVCFVVKIA